MAPGEIRGLFSFWRINLTFSRSLFNGDGSNTVFSISFPYLSKDHVSAEVDGVPVSFSWLNANAISITPAPSEGTIVRVKRTTPKDQPPVDFSDGSVLKEADLDLMALFNLYCAQEAQDGVDDSVSINHSGVLDGKGRKTTNFAEPTDPTGLVTRNYFETVYTPQLDAKVVAASQQAISAASSAADAQEAQGLAEDAQLAAEAARDGFFARYLGPQITPPTTRLDGTSLHDGDLYFRDVTPKGFYVWSAGSWTAAGTAIEGIANIPTTPVIADSGQTSVPVPGGFDPNHILVFVNGNKWDSPDIDVSSGSSILFTQALSGGEEISWIALGTFVVADAAPKAQVNSISSQVDTLSDQVAGLGAQMVDLSSALQLPDYAALRAYSGAMKSVYVTGYLSAGAPSGIAGTFVQDIHDTTTADNGSTVIVAANGVRWKRQQDVWTSLSARGRVCYYTPTSVQVFVPDYLPMSGFRFAGQYKRSRANAFPSGVNGYAIVGTPANLGAESSIRAANWYGVFAVADANGAVSYKLMPFLRVGSVSGSVATLNYAGEGANAHSVVAATYAWNSSLSGSDCLVITETVGSRANAFSGRVTRLTANTGTTVSLETVGGVAAYDFLLPAPPGFANYVYLGSFYSDSNGADIRNIADDGSLVKTYGTYSQDPNWQAAGVMPKSELRMGGYISPLATAVVLSNEYSLSTAGTGEVYCNFDSDSSNHTIHQDTCSKQGTGTVNYQDFGILIPFSFSQSFYFSVVNAGLAASRTGGKLYIRGYRES